MTLAFFKVQLVHSFKLCAVVFSSPFVPFRLTFPFALSEIREDAIAVSLTLSNRCKIINLNPQLSIIAPPDFRAKIWIWVYGPIEQRQPFCLFSERARTEKGKGSVFGRFGILFGEESLKKKKKKLQEGENGGGMETNKNRFIEDWSTARENLEHNFRWTRRNFALVGLFGIALPILVYKGIVKEFHMQDEEAGRPYRKFL